MSVGIFHFHWRKKKSVLEVATVNQEKRTRFQEKNKRKITEKPNRKKKAQAKERREVRFMRMILNIYVYNKFFVFVYFFSFLCLFSAYALLFQRNVSRTLRLFSSLSLSFYHSHRFVSFLLCLDTMYKFLSRYNSMLYFVHIQIFASLFLG